MVRQVTEVDSAIARALEAGEIGEALAEQLFLLLAERGAGPFPVDLSPGIDWEAVLTSAIGAGAEDTPPAPLLFFETVPEAPTVGTAVARHVALFHATQFEPLGAVQELRLQAFEVANIVASNALERANKLEEGLDELRADVNVTLSNLTSLIVTQQSENQDRAQAQEEIDAAAGEGGMKGFLGFALGFLASPFDSLFDVIGNWFLGEVRDGLNR